MYAGVGIIPTPEEQDSVEQNSSRRRAQQSGPRSGRERNARRAPRRTGATVEQDSEEQDSGFKFQNQNHDFFLFWWIRPPRRDASVVPMHLDIDDILDNNFKFPDIKIENEGIKIESWFSIIDSIEDENEDWKKFLIGNTINGANAENLTYELQERILELHNIEFREVDSEGKLVENDDNTTSDDKTKKKKNMTREKYERYMKALRHLVYKAVSLKYKEKLKNFEREGKNKESLESSIDFSDNSTELPRKFFKTSGRNFKGGD